MRNTKKIGRSTSDFNYHPQNKKLLSRCDNDNDNENDNENTNINNNINDIVMNNSIDIFNNKKKNYLLKSYKRNNNSTNNIKSNKNIDNINFINTHTRNYNQYNKSFMLNNSKIKYTSLMKIKPLSLNQTQYGLRELPFMAASFLG